MQFQHWQHLCVRVILYNVCHATPPARAPFLQEKALKVCEHVAPSQSLTRPFASPLFMAVVWIRVLDTCMDTCMDTPLYGGRMDTPVSQVIMVGFLVLESRGQRPYTFESAFAEYERRRSRNPGHNITKITKVGGSHVCDCVCGLCVCVCVTVCVAFV